MLNCINLCRITVEAFPGHNSHFSMVSYPVTQKFCTGRQYEIALYFFPYKPEFIVVGPNIVPGSGDDILARLRNIGSGTRFYVGTNIRITFKNPNGILTIESNGEQDSG